MDKDYKQLVKTYYEQLHGMPEVAFKEKKTTAYLLDQLKNIGFEIREKPGLTGLVGFLDSGKPGPTVALHSDIDAMLHMGDDGEERALHSCGHDANTAIVLAALVKLVEQRVPKLGRLAVLFQPAEERGQGAKAFLREGMLEGIDILIGSHLRPIQELPLGKGVPALYHGASLMVKGTITGEPAHGARPHLGVNVLDAVFNAYSLINSIRLNPMIPHSVKLTRLVAGGSSANQIPDRAEFAFDLRAQTNETMEELRDKVVQCLELGVQSLGAGVELEVGSGCPAAEYDQELIRLAENAIIDVLGFEGLAKPIFTPGGEDFHYYTEGKPQLRSVYLGLGANLEPGLHHPGMTFNHQALQDGVEILARFVQTVFDNQGAEGK